MLAHAAPDLPECVKRGAKMGHALPPNIELWGGVGGALAAVWTVGLDGYMNCVFHRASQQIPFLLPIDGFLGGHVSQ